MTPTQKNELYAAVGAIKSFEEAKADKKLVVDAAYQAYMREDGNLSKAAFTAIAQAIVDAEVQDREEYHRTMADTLAEVA